MRLTTNIIMIGAIVMVLVIPISITVSAYSNNESEFFREDGRVALTEERPAINPAFDPDYDCNLAYEFKCIPGSQQECPEGYHNGEDNVCSPEDCQEGYHMVDDDETGLYYPDSEGCPDDNFILIERGNGNEMKCAAFFYICDNEEHTNLDYCIEYRSKMARN